MEEHFSNGLSLGIWTKEVKKLVTWGVGNKVEYSYLPKFRVHNEVFERNQVFPPTCSFLGISMGPNTQDMELGAIPDGFRI